MIDAWSGPPPTPQQFPANEPNGIRKLLDKIKALELQVKESTSNLLRTAGIYLSPAGMTINSNLALTGTLDLPAGIIGNDALTSPVVIANASVQELGFNVVTAGVDHAVGSIPVPAGFSQALVFLIVTAEALNSTAAADNLYVSAVIGADVSRSMPVQCGAAGSFAAFAPVTSAKASTLTGLSGGSIYVAARVSSQVSTWTADAGNRATAEATAIFLR